MKGLPAYMRVMAHLQTKILTGILTEGTRLPSEMELEKEYGVSRTTIRKALNVLSTEGLIFIRQGQGSFVRSVNGDAQSLNKITSFSETIRRANKGTLSSKILFLRETAADAEQARLLEIKEGEPLFYLRRILYVDDKPIAHMTNTILKDEVPSLDVDIIIRTSLYYYLEHVLDIRMDSAIDRITAKGAEPEDVQLLAPAVRLGEPMLVNCRLTFTPARAFEIVRSVITGSEYEYSIMMHGRPFTAGR